MTTLRVFCIVPGSQGLISRYSGVHATIQEWVARMAIDYPQRTPIAYEVDAPHGMPPDSQAMYDRCLAAINAGNALHPQAKWHLDQFGVRRGLVLDATVTEATIAPATTVPPPTTPRTGKGSTVVVQDFIAHTDQAEVARRAWAATMAACKGMG